MPCSSALKRTIPKDLIAALQAEDQESDVVILDADTDWQLDLKYAGTDTDKIKEHAQHDFREGDKEKNRVYLVSNYWSL